MVSLQQWFFALPTETKRTIKRSASNSRGWFDDEYTKQKLDWKQCLDIGVEGRSDDIDGTNQWLGFPNSSPSDPPEYAEFREVMLRYFDAMTGGDSPCGSNALRRL
jgi:isopenicillin N synthase-like dioxygenase